MTCIRHAIIALGLLALASSPANAQIEIFQDATCFSDGVFELDGTCIDLSVIGPNIGTHRVAARTTEPLSEAEDFGLNFNDLDALNPVPAHFDPTDGIDLSSQITGNQLDLTITGSQSIGPSTTNPGVSEIQLGARVNETYILDDTFFADQTIIVDWEPHISGSMARPTNAPPGLTSLSVAINVLTTVNGNPVQTPIFSANLRYDEDDAGIQVIGNSASTFEIEDLDIPDVGQSYFSDTPIFNSTPITEGTEFTISIDVFGAVFSEGFASGDNSGWANTFANTIRLTATAPDTTTFTQVPEPGSAALLALALPLLSRRRTRR